MMFQGPQLHPPPLSPTEMYGSGFRRLVQVLFEGRKAVGVSFKHDGKQKVVRVNNEVILSAGTVGSAKLLMLSGVGPKSHLQSLKVSVLGKTVHFNIKVGQL